MAYQNVLASYLYAQNEESDTWVLVHNLGQAAPIVDCWTIYNGDITNIIPLSVTVNDPYTATVVFSSARTGFASVV
jgi:hypothetical protein